MRRLGKLACLSAIILIAGCSAGDSTSPSAAAAEAALTGTRWKLSAETADPGIADGNGMPITDLYSNTDSCDHDDFEIYSADHVFTINSGDVKCSYTQPQSLTGTWSLDAAGAVLTIQMNGKNQNEKVEQASASKLVLSTQAIHFSDGVPHTVFFTFSPF